MGNLTAKGQLLATVRCPSTTCDHPASQHPVAGEGNRYHRQCSGRVGLGGTVACGCGILQGEILAAAIESFSTLLLDHGLGSEAVTAVAVRLGVALQPTEYGFTRDGVLHSEAGRLLWTELVEREGWRDDDVAMRARSLALSFPTLADAAENGVLALAEGWSARELERFACGPSVTDGSLHAACFALDVWCRRRWACGVFEIHAAMSAWDPPHRAAFLAWVKDPWWA